MCRHDVIVIGASAGGVEALKQLVSYLPANLAAAVFIVVHFPATSASVLPTILSRYGPLPAVTACDGETIQAGRIYVAQPDYHLLLQNGATRLFHGPRENHTRPAIDPLFRSAAQAYGPRVVGVILSGMLNDGMAGLLEIKRGGGVAVVQDPEDALFGDMPRSAIKNVMVDYVAPIERIAQILMALSVDAIPPAPQQEHRKEDPKEDHQEDQKEPTSMSNMSNGNSNEISSEIPGETPVGLPAEMPGEEHSEEIVERDTAAQLHGRRNQMPSIYSCPDCGGVLWQVNEQEFVRFRCHVGHAYTAESLLLHQSEALEASMWYATRTLVDKAKLSLQLAERARERGHTASAARFEEQAKTAQQHAVTLRSLIEHSTLLRSAEAPDLLPQSDLPKT